MLPKNDIVGGGGGEGSSVVELVLCVCFVVAAARGGCAAIILNGSRFHCVVAVTSKLLFYFGTTASHTHTHTP